MSTRQSSRTPPRGGALFMLLTATAACASCPEPAPSVPEAPVFLHPFGAPTRPFSPAVRAGGLLFLAGQIGVQADTSGTLVPGGIEPETRQTMENIRRTLEAVGSSMDRIVKCTVFLADMAEWDRMNRVYQAYFAAPNFPARSALGANGLALGARVEIECIARADG